MKITNKRLQEIIREEVRQINETLPQFPKEWKGLEKAEKNYTKAVLTLGKAIGKVDKKGLRIDNQNARRIK